MQFTVALIPRYYVIYDLQSMSIQKSAYEDSDSCTDSEVDISSVSSQVPSTNSCPPRNKDKPTQNLLKKNDSFVAQELEESIKMSINYRTYGASNTILTKSARGLRIKGIISEVIMITQLIQLNQLQKISNKWTKI